MISAPLVLIASPLIAAVLVYFIRRITPLASLLAAAAALWLAWLANATPATGDRTILAGRVVGGELSILGRTLVLAPDDRLVLVAISLAAALLFLLAIKFHHGGTFFPGLLTLLGIAAAVLVTETFIFQVLLIEVTAGILTILMQGSRYGSTRGAWRFFLFTSLALPFLLVAGWQIDFQAANPGQANLLNPAVLLLTLGFAIYLTAVPFHLWLGPAATETRPLAQVVVFGIFPLLVLSVLDRALFQFPWFATSDAPRQWFAFLGALSCGIGAILAFGANSLGKLAAYTLLIDAGTVLMLLGLEDQNALTAAWVVLLLRVVSLTLWTTALAAIKSHKETNLFQELAGRGRQSPLVSGMLLLGGLALAGFPLAPGFAGRWLATGLVAGQSTGRALLLLLGTASSTIGVLRLARTLLAPESESTAEPERLHWLAIALLVIVLVGSLLVVLYPQPVISLASDIASLVFR